MSRSRFLISSTKNQPVSPVGSSKLQYDNTITEDINSFSDTETPKSKKRKHSSSRHSRSVPSSKRKKISSNDKIISRDIRSPSSSRHHKSSKTQHKRSSSNSKFRALYGEDKFAISPEELLAPPLAIPKIEKIEKKETSKSPVKEETHHTPIIDFSPTKQQRESFGSPPSIKKENEAFSSSSSESHESINIYSPISPISTLFNSQAESFSQTLTPPQQYELSAEIEFSPAIGYSPSSRLELSPKKYSSRRSPSSSVRSGRKQPKKVVELSSGKTPTKVKSSKKIEVINQINQEEERIPSALRFVIPKITEVPQKETANREKTKSDFHNKLLQLSPNKKGTTEQILPRVHHSSAQKFVDGLLTSPKPKSRVQGTQ